VKYLKLWELTEADLFYYLKANWLPDLNFTVDHYDRIDAVTKDYEMVLELKCRRAHYSQMIIEKDKYDALISKAKQLNYDAAYVNSTPLGIYLWNITGRELQWSKAILPAKSFGQTLTFTNKIISYLPIDDAVEIRYI
jgi:hypothetical protein